MKTELISAISGALIGFGDPLIKHSMNTLGVDSLVITDLLSVGTLFLNIFFLLGIFLAVLGSIVYIVSLSRGKASIVNPLSGGASYITLVILSTFMLGESVTITKILGMSIIVFGIYLVSRFCQTKEECENVKINVKEVNPRNADPD